jgi:hypothetical protein
MSVWRGLPCALVLIVISLASGARDALGCASCGCGDPTLTGLGMEQPFAGRLRSALELSYRTDSIGNPGRDQVELREARADASIAWAPIDTLFLSAIVPSLYRQALDATLTRAETWGIGDVELRAKWFAYRDRAFAPRLLLAAVGGVKLPTAPWQSDSQGNLVALEAQPGTGSLDLLLGISLSTFQGATSSYASIQWSLPQVSRAPLEPGNSLRASLALQHQLVAALALRAAADGRWDAQSHEGGRPDPNSGGWVLFLGGDVLVSPMVDLSLSFGVRAPAASGLAGAHEEGLRASAAVMRDW